MTQFRLTGGQIDFILLSRVDYQSDLYVGQIKGSSSVWSGINFPIYLPVFSERGGEATLQVFVNGQLYREGNFKLQEGYITLPIMLRAGNPGVMQVEARVLFDGDQFPENNSAFASFRVYEQPRILVVTKNEGALDHFISAISEQNSEVVVIAPEMLPTSIEELESFQVIFVHDVLAQDFNFEQMQAIRLHVLELGKGLVFLGGRNSYTLGGYQNTALEPLMPIVLAPPDRVQRVPITFLLVLDRSGSMAGDRNTEISPIDLTREAAMRAIETLRSDDYLGVLTFSGTTQWDVDLRNVGEGLELRNAQDKVSQIVAIGGTFMYRALDEAVHELINTETTDYPHILLMSDGVSGDGSMDEFVQLVQNARENGITISTIALGQESDPETLARIAELGGGRFYVVNDPADLPTVMISESRAVQAENVQEGRTNMIMGVEDHPILAGFSLDELPLI
ncbi:MAG: VWA domain-containing protein [Gammaproteobacteria bacterium]|nr:VWA domain-containing protein [Gammaproteobacteria bacterium]